MSIMNHRVLVVEDEEKLARFMELELKYEGYNVSVAKDGIVGLNQAQEFPPDLVLLDG
ncbi:MAG: OmpR subfamily protein Rre28, partial [Cyanobacteriota bacterium]